MRIPMNACWELTIILFALTLTIPDVLSAASGDPDFTFDADGWVITPFGSSEDYSHDVLIQADGTIVAAGLAGSVSDFALVRYNNNGGLDTTFDFDGRVTTDFNGDADVIHAIASQNDGKIVAAGITTVGSSFDFALARYNTDGSLDSSFSFDGRLTTDFATNGDAGLAVTVQSDGKIIVAGAAEISSNLDFALVRYNPDGSLDSTFDSDGRVITDFASNNDIVYAVTIQADGKILAAGVTFFSGNFDFALARYNPDGSLDTTFDSDGRVTTDFASDTDYVYAAVVQADGKIVIAGGAVIGVGLSDFAIVRYNADGSLDDTFGSDGKATADFAELDIATGLALQPDGKIVAGGATSMIGASVDFALARFNTDGSLDNSFSSDGKVTADFDGDTDEALDLSIQTDGRIVLAGATYSGTDFDFAVARFEGDPPPPCIFCDDFEDGILAPDWNYVKPLWSELSGTLTAIPSGKKAEAIADPVFQGCSLCTMQATMRTSGGIGNRIWLLCWYQDKENAIELLMKEESDRWILKQRAGGTIVSKVKVAAPIVPGIFYDVQISFDGSDFVLNVNGTTLATVPASIIPNGTIGFRVKNTTGGFGSVSVN